MTFKNIIFDWSGVVKDVSVSHYFVVKKMFEALGNEDISIEEIKDVYDEPYMNFWKRYFPDLTIEEEQRLYRKALADKDYPVAAPFSSIVDLIKEIKKKGVRMAILSSDFAETLLPEVEKFGLGGIFDEIVPFVHEKSDAIHGLIERNNFAAENTVFVGDTDNEIKAGKRAGLKTIAVSWGVSSENKLKIMEPDFLVRDVDELKKVLLS